MSLTTSVIVLSSIKYGDSSLIVKCYTQTDGLKTYMLKGILSSSKRKKIKPAHFQPLTQLQIVANHNAKGNLNSIKEVQVVNNYTHIHTDVKKQTIAMFISEVLSQILTEEKNEYLYEYLKTSFLWLDQHDKISNFHILFLLKLTKFLGFYPDSNYSNTTYFNLDEGKFSNAKPKFNYITGEQLSNFKLLLGTNFDTINDMIFNQKSRQELLSILIQYYELHLSGFRNPKSLQILKAVFN